MARLSTSGYGALGDDIDGDGRRPRGLAERLEQRLEVGALLEPLEGPHHVVGRQLAARLKLHAVAQMKARGALVDLSPSSWPGAARSERSWRKRTSGSNRRCESWSVAPDKLLMGVERGGIGVVGHAQRLASGRGAQAPRTAQERQQRKSGQDAWTALCRPKQTAVQPSDSPLPATCRGSIQSPPVPRPIESPTRARTTLECPRVRLFRHRDRYRCRQDARFGLAA